MPGLLDEAYNTLRWFGEHPKAAAMMQQQQMERADQGFRDMRPGWQDPQNQAKWTGYAQTWFPQVNPFNPAEAGEGPDWRDWRRELPVPPATAPSLASDSSYCPFCGK